MQPEQEDIILLQRLKEGDAEAFSLVYEKYRDSLKFRAFIILKNNNEAQDLVQDFFLESWEKGLFERIEVEKSRSGTRVIQNYLFTAIHNRAINVINRSKVNAVSIKQHHYEELIPESSYNPETQLQQKEQEMKHNDTWQRLQWAIDNMPPQTAKIFSLAYGAEPKNRHKIAEELNISYQTVKNVLSRTYTKLRDYLNNEGNGTTSMKMCINDKRPQKVNKLSREEI